MSTKFAVADLIFWLKCLLQNALDAYLVGPNQTGGFFKMQILAQHRLQAKTEEAINDKLRNECSHTTILKDEESREHKLALFT